MLLKLPEIGNRAWAINSIRCPLPDGLENRTEISVLETGTRGIVVQDQRGRKWMLSHIQVDAGHGHFLDGEYCFETHPKAVLHLRYSLLALEERMRGEREELHGNPAWWQEDRERIRWYLSRNGFDPDDPVPPDSRPPELTGAPRAEVVEAAVGGTSGEIAPASGGHEGEAVR